MFTLKKTFHFEAGHALFGLEKTHPCMAVHGHSYKVTCAFCGPALNQNGMLIDYNDMEPIKDWLNKHCDHKYLNSQFEFNPTAENMAVHFFNVFKLSFPTLCSVKVCETDKTSAKYELD